MSAAVRIFCAAVWLAAASGCSERPDTGHASSVDAWHAERLARLQAADGWLTLIGLFPLPEGEHSLGTGEGADLRFVASAPPVIGTLTVATGEVLFTAAAAAAVFAGDRPVDAPLVMATDRDRAPTVLQVGSVSFQVIARGEGLLLRVKDSESAVRRSFTGIDRFPVDAKWRIVARLQTHGAPSKVPITTMLGHTEEEPCPGLLTFACEGSVRHLLPIGEPGQPLFIIFTDRTNGTSTYGGGRFLYADPPRPDGTVILDFNRAFNPPCAFTPYATCPLPPAGNAMPIEVTAGEKAWRYDH